MSSHHIVRENQEPALIVDDFHALDMEQFGQLLEWSPTIITHARNVDFFLAEGIKFDILFGSEERVFSQEAIKFVALAPGSNFVDAALDYLIVHRFGAANILLSEELLPLVSGDERINTVVFAKNRRYAFFKSTFEKWKPKGERLFIPERTIKSFQGLDYINRGEFISSADGFVRVEFSTIEWVLVGEEI